MQAMQEATEDMRAAEGMAAFKAGDTARAVASFRAAVEAAPGRADLWCNLGVALVAGGAPAPALAAYERATALAPGLATGWSNNGRLLAKLDRLEEALAALGRAAALEPRLPQLRQWIAGLLRDLGRPAEAVAWARDAVALAEEDRHPPEVLSDATLELSQMLLAAGRWPEGWRRLEEGLALTPGHAPDLPGPRWRGEAIGRRRVLVWCDQGYGDMLNFVRYIVPAAERAAIVLAAPPPLHRLFRTLPVPLEIAPETGIGYEAHVPLHALPGLFGADAHDVRVPAPYLFADPAETEAWRARLAALPGLRVGLVWAGGGPDRSYDARRSLRLADFAPLFEIPGVSFVSLQKGPGAAQSTSVPNLFDPTGQLHDFAATAALVCALDLVVSVDTAVAHLAGALGRPVWMLNRLCSDGRWPVGGPPVQGTPWYGSMRVHRQRSSHDWRATVATLAADLAAHASGAAAAS